MRKTLYILIVLIVMLPLLTIVSCKKDGSSIVLRAEVPANSGGDSGSKGDDDKIERVGSKLSWIVGDEICVFDRLQNSAIYQLTSGAGMALGKFQWVSEYGLSVRLVRR